jgi:tetratricopeptide (TPR) repeat protein
MKSPDPVVTTQAFKNEAPSLPPGKWWGGFVVAGNPPQRRFVFKWGRILSVVVAFVLVCYLGLATALWGYYSLYRKIPGVNWIDVAVLPRFSRVQAAIGDYYYNQAKQFWEKRDLMRGIMTARAAVQKAPSNLEARLFLAGCWLQVGRDEEALRTLRGGIQYHATDPQLQKALMEVCLRSAHYDDLLKLLRDELPRSGVHLLSGDNISFKLAEIQAVLETAGPAEAETVASRYTGLAETPSAAPVLSRIDWELDRHDAAFERLRIAREHSSNDSTDSTVQDAYIDMALRLQKTDEARAAAQTFLTAYPNLVSAQLRFLETHSSRAGLDQGPWLRECMRFLVQYRHTPVALGQLASLAATQGWADLTFLLYQNSLQENLTGFPFAIYYVGSLVKAGDYVAAEKVWRELRVRNSAQLEAASYVEAMVASGGGRESDAMQVIERLRRETENSRVRRRGLEQVFRSFGFQKLADQLVAAKSTVRAGVGE